MRVHEALQFAKLKRGNADAGTVQSLDFFIKTFDRGSKPFRRILQHKAIKSWNIENLNTVKTFCDITQVTQPNKYILRSCWGDWNRTYYRNRCRELLYKFRNNILGLNSRVCKFVQGIDAECSLCVSKSEPRPIHSETFLHTFFDCAYLDKYRVEVENRLFPEIRNASPEERRRFWFFAILPGMEKNCPFISLIINLVNFFLWECKLRKECIPSGTLVENVIFGTKKALKISLFLRTEKQKANFFVCRYISDPP
jgi:hypothetical protein